MNNCTFLGRIGRLEAKFLQNGTAITEFSVAVDDGKNPEDGTRKTLWINCVAFKQLAEIIAEHFEKGRVICVSGRLQCRKWQAQDGTNRESWSLTVRDFSFGGDKATERPADEQQAAPVAPPDTGDPNVDPFGDE